MNSGAARWIRLRHILAEAMELHRSKRPHFLDCACAGDGELRRNVESLLVESEESDEFLVKLAGRAGLPFAGSDAAPPSGLERIGAYRLLRRIGEGGMGTVYLAERADGESEMRVAVKLLPGGVRTESMRRRFAAERQILGRLGHAGIARFLDGGVTDGGIPFLVMEYASGVPIDAYCDDNLLDTDQRLSLFLEVCQAVEYAHGNAVVHRDLKPGNILVSADGRVKLLDFGVAKILGAATGDSTVTEWGERPLTLAYASPEQVMGERVGFASDVYQLGVLLYLLLSGRLPTDRPVSGSWAELSRAVLGRRAIPLSTAVGLPGQRHGASSGADPEERARVRRSGVASLRARLAGAMDAILLKTLRPEPERRYATVAELSREIRRYREGNPVAAQLEVFVRPAGLAPIEGTTGSPPPAMPTAPLRRPIQPDRLAVLPFATPPGETLGYLRHGLVTLLAAALDDTSVFTVVEPSAVLRLFAPGEAAVAGPVEARARAEQLGAGMYALGDVVEVGPSIRLSVSLYDLRNDDAPRTVATAEGAARDVLKVVEALAIEILCAAAPTYAREMARAAAREADSLAVFKLFMRGEMALSAGAFFAAAEAFQRAVQESPDFALGYYRLAMAAFWGHNLGLTRRFAGEAASRSERLPLRERRLLAALEKYLDGHATAAEETYSALLRESPGDMEAAFLAGTLLFFHNPLRGRPRLEARPFFERVLSIQPTHILSLLYLSTIVARDGDVALLEVLTERLLEVYPDGGLPGYPIVARAQRAFASEGALEQDRAIEELRGAGSLAAITAVQVVVIPGRSLDGADRVVQLLVSDSGNGGEVRATGHVLRAHLELGRGRLAGAERELQLAEALGCTEAREIRVLFALSPFLDTPRHELEALRTAMLSWDVVDLPDGPPAIPHFAPHHGVHTHVQNFLLGLTSARLGERDEALELAHGLDAAALSSDEIALSSFAETIRAEIHRLCSGAAEALAAWQPHELGTSVERALSSSLFAHGHARFLRAEMLREAGREDEALSWYSTFGDLSAHDAIYLAPAHLKQAEILGDRGDHEGAGRHYRLFLDLWRDCDALLRPEVDAARHVLEA